MADDENDWKPSDEDGDRFHHLMRRFSERGSSVPMAREDLEMLLGMRAELETLRRQNAKFLEGHQIKAMAHDEAIAVVRSLGFDVDHMPETAQQVLWLLSLKRGVRGFIYAILTVVLTACGTLATTFLTSKWR